MSFEERFWNKVTMSVDKNDCWEWTAAKFHYGHGAFKILGKMYKAHRISYELCVGKIPEGLCVCHHCDNPPCVNPGHLYVGTMADNTLDRDLRKRTSKGESHHKTKISDLQLVQLRKSSLGVKQLAKKYSLSEGHIYKLRRNALRVLDKSSKV